MKRYKHVGIYGDGESYVLETLEDWDEYEKFMNVKYPDWKRCNPNFYTIKEEFKKYIGKIWKDDSSRYTIIAIEDDDPNADWYWVIKNIDDDCDTKYKLVSDSDFYDHII